MHPMTEVNTGGFADIQGAPLYYEAAGRGHPLLLLHEGIADSRMFDEQAVDFARYYRTIRFDLRGSGRSQVPAGPFANHEDAAELLRYLNAAPAHVLGMSYGGLVALDFTLAHPEMVTSLILVAPGVSGDEQTSENVRRFQQEEKALLEQGNLEAASDLNVRFWVVGPRRQPEQVDSQVRRRVYEMQYHAFTVPIPDTTEEIRLDPPAISRLSEVRVPTLLIVGDQDLPEKVEQTERLAREITNARRVVIPGGGHAINMEQPEAFNRVVRDFLSSV
jgi:3-oxoadipate enol-lactonase